MIHFYKQLHLDEFQLEPEAYMKYVEEFHKTLGYNIRYSEMNDIKSKVISKPSEFIIALYTKPRKSFVLDLKGLTEWEGYMFFEQNPKEYVKPLDNQKKILAILMTIPSLVTKAKRMKTVAEQLHNAIGDGALIENEELIFKMDRLEGFIDKALKELEDLNINALYDPDKNMIIVPYGNMVMREFSTKEIIMVSSTIVSMFKYLYSIDKGGKDIVENMNLLSEFNKWKTARKNELKEIDDRVGD